MKKIIFFSVAILNIVALYNGAGLFFVTFADVPMQVPVSPAEIGHIHHKGMEDMRDFLFPCLKWLVGTMLVNFIVMGFALFGKRRS
jgi:hypothetical protein